MTVRIWLLVYDCPYMTVTLWLSYIIVLYDYHIWLGIWLSYMSSIYGHHIWPSRMRQYRIHCMTMVYECSYMIGLKMNIYDYGNVFVYDRVENDHIWLFDDNHIWLPYMTRIIIIYERPYMIVTYDSLFQPLWVIYTIIYDYFTRIWSFTQMFAYDNSPYMIVIYDDFRIWLSHMTRPPYEM